MAQDHWYDGQLRRYWLQFSRIFEGITYETGVGANGTKVLRTFPVRMATKDRMIGHIMRNNSENTMMTVPQVTYFMTDIQKSDERRQNPNHVSAVNVVERAIDAQTNRYTGERGRAYTVERFMAIPYDITMQVDVWTSNEDQKHQFMEQILMLFNPSIDLQTSDNPLDWTSLGIVTLDSVSWTNRTMPIGTDSDIEVSSLTFKMPIWISPPAKVKKQNIINQIITNINMLKQEDLEELKGEDTKFFTNVEHATRSIVTPGNYRLEVDGNTLTLLSENNLPVEHETWESLLHMYGRMRPGVSQIRIKTTDNMDDHASDIIGTIDFMAGEPNKLVWTMDIDTLKANTLQPVNLIIDPHKSFPGIHLPAPVSGQRYMLLDDIGPSQAWGNIQANVNDIIEYENGQWIVKFDASIVTDPQHVMNIYSGKQYYWTGEIWRDAVSGIYNPGYWRIFL